MAAMDYRGIKPWVHWSHHLEVNSWKKIKWWELWHHSSHSFLLTVNLGFWRTLWNYEKLLFYHATKKCHSSCKQFFLRAVSDPMQWGFPSCVTSALWPKFASQQSSHGFVRLQDPALWHLQELRHAIIFVTFSQFQHRLIMLWELFTFLILNNWQKEALLHLKMWLTQSSLAFNGTGICVRCLISQPGFHAWMNTATSILLQVRKSLLKLPKLNRQLLC